MPNATCSACGAELVDESGTEFRHRVSIQDTARSKSVYTTRQLCPTCWERVAAFINGKGGAHP